MTHRLRWSAVSGPPVCGPPDHQVSALRDVWEATSFELERRQCDAACVASEQEGLSTRRTPAWALSFKPSPTPAAKVRAAPGVARALRARRGRARGPPPQSAGRTHAHRTHRACSPLSPRVLTARVLTARARRTSPAMQVGGGGSPVHAELALAAEGRHFGVSQCPPRQMYLVPQPISNGYTMAFRRF